MFGAHEICNKLLSLKFGRFSEKHTSHSLLKVHGTGITQACTTLNQKLMTELIYCNSRDYVCSSVRSLWCFQNCDFKLKILQMIRHLSFM